MQTLDLEKVKSGEIKDLRGADLRGADLSDTDLRCADLSDADLSDADLSDANLSGAYLRNANLRCVNLSDANLRCVNLRDANLRGAYLIGANFRGAYLRGADLSDADLRWLTCGNNLEIKTLQAGTWIVVMTSEVMAIGCQQHKLTEWWQFSDEEIACMSPQALDWWCKFKPILQQIHQLSFPQANPQ